MIFTGTTSAIGSLRAAGNVSSDTRNGVGTVGAKARPAAVRSLGHTVPNASNLDFGAGQAMANTVIVAVGADGEIDLCYGGPTTGSVGLAADVSGYFSASGSGAYDDLILPNSSAGRVQLIMDLFGYYANS